MPLSSSGHLTLAQRLFQYDGGITFDIALHLGTLFAVFVIYRKRLWELIRKPFQPYNFYLLAATLPTIIFVLLFESWIENSFNNTFFIIGFFVTAILLITAGNISKRHHNEPLTYKTGILMGIFQGFGCFPGVSRSGSTICAALMVGTDRTQAADFSFLMSIPIILGSCIWQILKGGTFNVPLLEVGFGTLAAFLSGLVAIRFMINRIKRANFTPFIVYLIVLGIVCCFLF